MKKIGVKRETNLEIRFEVGGEPIAEPRKRVSVNGGKVTVFQPDHPVVAYKEMVFYRAREARPSGWNMANLMEVDLLFVMPRRKSPEFAEGPKGRRWHTGAPDIDNLAKSTLDGLKGAAWDDDTQAVDCRMVKVFARVGEEPHVVVRVRYKSEEVPGLEIEI